MRRSRDLAFKRDRESKLQNVMSTPDSRRDVTKTSSSSSSSVTSGSSLFTSQRPSSRSSTVILPQNNLVSKNSKSSSQSKNKFLDEEEDEEDIEPSFDDDHDDYHNEHDEKFEDELSEQEEEIVEVKKPQAKSGGRKSTKSIEKTEEPLKTKKKTQSKIAEPQKTRKTKQELDVSKVKEDESRHDEEPEDDEQQDESGRKRRQNIVSKAILSKLLNEAGIEGVSSDVHGFIIEEMQFFINDVIRILGDSSNGEELVVRDSDLKFLGDKSKAQGHLDVKSFEKVYKIVATDLDTNAEFSSEAFKTLGKLTEIHVVQFLKKAGNVIKFYGRKRLTVKDLELLKEMLEDEK